MSEKNSNSDFSDYSPEELSRRFEQITNDLGEIAEPRITFPGPRDWVAPEDHEGFIPPEPPPVRFSKKRTAWGIAFLLSSIIGFILIALLNPVYETVLNIVCLLFLATGLGLLFSLLSSSKNNNSANDY